MTLFARPAQRSKATHPAAKTREEKVRPLRELFSKKSRVTSKELVVFSRQLSTLVSAGVPIVRGLQILGKQARNPAFKETIDAVRADIEAGASISEAIAKHPQTFPEFYAAMVKAGELGGILDVILERLSTYLENAEALRGKVKSALTYPTVVLGICAAVTIFLMVFVIPTFERIFASFGGELPFVTRALIAAARWTKTLFPLIVGAPLLARWAFARFYTTERGRRLVDGKLLASPLFGPLLVKVAVAKFTRTLGTLVRSGVPIMSALDTVAAVAGNVVVADAVLATRASIREGGRLSEPLLASGIFPEMVVSMIGVGEETGALDTMLAKIADFYDGEVDAEVKTLTSLIEPLVMVVMGIVIGTIVIAMFLPMMNLPNLVG